VPLEVRHRSLPDALDQWLFFMPVVGLLFLYIAVCIQFSWNKPSDANSQR
jgi:hypothetical protein